MTNLLQLKINKTSVQVLIEELRRKVKAAHYISVSVDDSAAIDNTEYMSVEVYYIGPKGFKKTAFLKLQPVAATTAKDLTNTLVRHHVHMLKICTCCTELPSQGRDLIDHKTAAAGGARGSPATASRRAGQQAGVFCIRRSSCEYRARKWNCSAAAAVRGSKA